MISGRLSSAIFVILWAGAVPCRGADPATPLAPDFTLASAGGFCPNGAWLPAPGKPGDLKTFGSFCEAGDGNTGTAKTSSFPASGNLTLYLAGYPSGNGLGLWIENTNTGEKFSIHPLHDPGDSWQPYAFALPRGWRGQPISLTAADNTTAVHGWFAFSEPISQSSTGWGTLDAVSLLIAAILHGLLLALPALAACAWAAAKGVRNAILLAAMALVAMAAAGYLGFWINLYSPELGSHYGVDLAIAGAVVFVFQFRRLDTQAKLALGRLILPASLTGVAALLILATGFLYEGVSAPLDTPARRFSHQLPPDNRIPYLFAEHLREGRIPSPMLGDWLSSDRPPLQTGMVLAQYAFMRRRDLGYTVLSVILQSLWILGALSVLESFQVDRRAAALALGVALFSGFVFVNAFFVWPKLLAAAFLLVLLALLHEIDQGRLPAGMAMSAIAGSLAAFALLAHGGSTFGLLGLGLFVIVRGRRRLHRRAHRRKIAAAALALASLYVPWMLYQKLLDPPGDRLMKMHLAGIDKPDARPFFETLAAAYQAVGLSGTWHNKLANLGPLVGHPLDYWGHWLSLLGGPGEPGTLAEHLRAAMFFEFLPSLGLVGLGAAALVIGWLPRKRSVEWSAAFRIWLLIGAIDLIWVLMMFGPGTTFIHQGTYLTLILGFLGGTLALWAAAPWIACTVGGGQVLLSFWLYFVEMRDPLPNGSLIEGAPRMAIALVAVAALGATGAILIRTVRPSPTPLNLS